jgi:hypothetical protein
MNAIDRAHPGGVTLAAVSVGVLLSSLHRPPEPMVQPGLVIDDDSTTPMGEQTPGLRLRGGI